MIDNPRAQVLLVDSGHPHPAWSRAVALDSGENRRMTSVAVSPDGRWLAVGGWKEAGIRVWDLHLHRLERLLRPNDIVGHMTFVVALQSRWPMADFVHIAPISDHPYDFWRTGTWELAERIDQERHGGAFHPPVFTADGRLMALGIAPDQVLLADAATGREVRAIDDLAGDPTHAAGFQPRRHEAGRRHGAEDRSGLGSAANPRPARSRWGWTGTRRPIPKPTRARPKPLPA